MRRFTCAAAVATATVLLSALWMEPAAMAAPAAGLPAVADKGLAVAATVSCPRLAAAKCAKGYRAECTSWTGGWWWDKGGQKRQYKCCATMGCVPHLSNPQTKQPFQGPKPLPGSRRLPPSPITR